MIPSRPLTLFALLFLALLPAFAGCLVPRDAAMLPDDEAVGADAPPASASPSPYVGQEARPIKALSEKEVDDLLYGRGMGFAKAAELNSYPGPAHVLELADALELSVAQRDAVEAVRVRMNESAVALGARIVDEEAALDAAFAQERITLNELELRTAEIARLTGELRAVHLAAHLDVAALLDDAQVARYDELRGYATAGEDAPSSEDSGAPGGSHGGGHGGH